MVARRHARKGLVVMLMTDETKFDILRGLLAEAKMMAKELGASYFNASIHFRGADKPVPAPIQAATASYQLEGATTQQHLGIVEHWRSAEIDGCLSVLVVQRKEPIAPQPEEQASQDSMRDLGTY